MKVMYSSYIFLYPPKKNHKRADVKDRLDSLAVKMVHHHHYKRIMS